MMLDISVVYLHPQTSHCATHQLFTVICVCYKISFLSFNYTDAPSFE